MELLPGRTLMSRDNIDSMRVANVASGKLPGLERLGIETTPLESDRAALPRPRLRRGAPRGLARSRAARLTRATAAGRAMRAAASLRCASGIARRLICT